MNAIQKNTMAIHFNDGTKKILEFPAPVTDCDANLAVRLKETLNARHLAFEADGALVVIPVGSIKYIKSFPVPHKLPTYMIRGGKLYED